MAKATHCCKINCLNQAEWEIRYGEGPDDYTHACTEHVGEMLTDAPIHYVYPIDLSDIKKKAERIEN